MKILTTNWVPAIAQELLLEGLVANQLESRHIDQAIDRVENDYKLFQLTLFIFNKEAEGHTVRYGGHIPKVCPAKKTITANGIEYLPKLYTKVTGRS